MKTLTLALITLAVLFISCSQDESTKYENPPVILDENWVEITDTSSIEIKCLDGDKIDEKYIIRDSDSYNELYEILWQYNDCPDYELPSIDFDEYSLLAYRIGTGRHYTEKQFYSNEEKKEYLYHLDVVRQLKIINGDTLTTLDYCVSMNWLLVPKLLNGYTMNFDTTIIYEYKTIN